MCHGRHADEVRELARFLLEVGVRVPRGVHHATRLGVHQAVHLGALRLRDAASKLRNRRVLALELHRHARRDASKAKLALLDDSILHEMTSLYVNRNVQR